MKLVLEDGTTMTGRCFGAPRAVSGEVVFNTGMTGYVETLTDPSYRGQILAITYPLVGNYGVPAPRQAGSVDGPYEADRIQVQGLVVQSYVERYSHHAAVRSLGAWLASEGIPAITGIDTRTLTRRLREAGTMKGWLFPAEMDLERVKRSAEAVDMREEVFRLVSPREPITYEGGPLKVLLIDAGAKDNIVRSLLQRGVTVIRAPFHAPIAELAEAADGVLIGNGPGDPKDLGQLVAAVRGLLGTYTKPIFGICLGNQILALAAGGDTYKLPYGHRGVNQPVQDLLSRRCYVTSQNHGYAVKHESLPPEWEPWFININDGTNEGIRSRLRPFFSVQFHPEATPGPEDAGYLFDDFLRLCGAMKGSADSRFKTAGTATAEPRATPTAGRS
ncbi:glutamine-hydrolyzing carbamoyl-phosphate synthase small subunit [Sorangium sp. So ce406]|uniref:glutamine-hydrolyzing carbamoyl-phosphate synthase small subunit n=1 Tax=Sorangium sp. So ce406 TaxID=3133311 RepID=UPI003F5B597B